MKMKFINICLFTAGCLFVTGCNDDNEIFFEDLTGNKALEMVHPNDRDQPYPREEHELFVNPAPLIVPKVLRGEDEFLEFELSQDNSFPEKGTYRSGKLNWDLYNVHEQLATGDWYWRFRKVDANDKATIWSEVYKFTVTGKEEVFVTPKWEVFQQNIPATYPRINCFLEEDIAKVSPIADTHPEYKSMISRANGKDGLGVKLPANPHDYGMEALANNTRNYLNTAWRLTKDRKYYDKILEIGRTLINYGITDDQLKKYENFAAGGIVDVVSLCYDLCQESLTEDEKTKAEQLILKIVNYYYRSYTGRIENHIFDNHTWQIVLRNMTQGALVICQEYPEAMNALEYFYELWTGCAPASGFNRSGAWQNGISYFGTNCYTLYWMPMLFSHLTQTDFLKHPWYKNAGKAIAYTWLPGSGNCSFGDGVEKWMTEPGRVQVGFMDFLARETGDSYAAWYAKECAVVLKDNFDMRLYRIAQGDADYTAAELDDSAFENFIWHKDIGEGVAHSDMRNLNSNLSLAFRSSPYGSGSHTLADQNGFKLLYKGRPVYISAGYYQNFADKHNLLQYRNTRGHNTIMINGIGQPFTTKAYGNICRGLNGENIAYFLGDASNAYCGTSDQWESNFVAAGISQTPEFGFGDNPLNNYKRHIFMLRPNKIVIYDELGADEVATWQWLLHSPVEMHVAGNKVTTDYTYEGRGSFTSVAQIYSEQTPDITATDEWFPGGEPADQDPVKYPKQWHLTANFGPSLNNKILTVIQVTENGSVDEIWQVNNRFTLGDWKIEAEMAADKPAAITISNKLTGAMFSYGTPEVIVGGAPYKRQQENSSVLYDNVQGTMQVQESTDKPLQTTRALK